MSTPRRKPTRANATAVAGLVLVPFVTYVLSYAPVAKWRSEQPVIPSPGDDHDAIIRSVYRPVDWLIDNTPLREPLFWWANLWGVGDTFELRYEVRNFPRDR